MSFSIGVLSSYDKTCHCPKSTAVALRCTNVPIVAGPMILHVKYGAGIVVPFLCLDTVSSSRAP